MARITVFGAGVFGLSIAWVLARRGAAVTVVDPAGPGGGASGGIVGALAPHVPENWNAKKAFQFDSLEMAAPFWAEVAEVSGRDPGYARLGRWQPILEPAGIALAEARCQTAEALWQGRYRWQVIDAPDPALLPSPTGKVTFDDLSARIHPRRAMAALAEALRRRGVAFVERAPEAVIEVWAKGAEGLEDLSQDLGQPLGMGIKGQAALLEFAAPDLPQLFVDGLHIIPHGDGTTAIGSTTERDYVAPTETDKQLDDLIDRARALVPALRNAKVLERWAGLRPRARSRAPMLGPHPKRADTFIANGGFKIGFGMAPKVAAVMADLILEGHDAIPEGFRVEDNLR